jgi:hypothetical protein
MGRADGLSSPQDPRRLPRLPRRHPLQRKRFTADPMSTGEPDATENGHVRFGKGSSEKELHPGATSPATYFTSRPDLWGPGGAIPPGYPAKPGWTPSSTGSGRAADVMTRS